MILIDTSAIIAILSPHDKFHSQAKETWFNILDEGKIIHCNNYILLEAISLIQKRYGLDILRAFQSDILPILQVEWIDQTKQTLIMNALLLANQRSISVVDYASFETMRRQKIQMAFTFDKHFRDQGFKVIP